jgi:anti-sigma B factor antagonist
MEIRQHSVGPVALLHPAGKLVLNEEPPDAAIRDALMELMSRGYRKFVVDLRDISQVDTSGLASLVAANLAVVRRGGALRLASPPRRLREVLAMTKLDTFFEVCADEHVAMNGWTGEEEQSRT